jgi:hypothetical protein
MKKGDKLRCLETIYNLMGKPLFKKDEVYNVIYIDNESVNVMVCLDHILYANEYQDFEIEWVKKNFEYVKG